MEFKEDLLMRIFTKKAFKFRGEDKAVTTAALSFADVPDWVKKDPIFPLAVTEGSIELIESKADERQIEVNGTTKQESETSVESEKSTDPKGSDDNKKTK
jgi:hypothetical protein